jgi:hypothetical protein
MSMMTNWLGYILLAGAVFCFWPLELPPNGRSAARGCASSAWPCWRWCSPTWCCARSARGRVWRIRGHDIKTCRRCRWRSLQLAMSCTNWSLIGGVIWFLLQGQVDYVHVHRALADGRRWPAWSRTCRPGSACSRRCSWRCSSHRWPSRSCSAALLAYRGLYYLLPLVVATVGYGVAEARARRLRAVASPR